MGDTLVDVTGQGATNPLAEAARALITSGAATREQVVAAQAKAKSEGGIFATRLVEAGVPVDAVLQAHGGAYGLPVVASLTLDVFDPSQVSGIDLTLCNRLLAVPFGREGDTLLIAFAQPAWAASKAAQALPTFQPHLGEEAAVRRALARLAVAASSPAATAAPPPGSAGDTSLMASGLAAGGPSPGEAPAPASPARPPPPPAQAGAPPQAPAPAPTGAAPAPVGASIAPASVATTGSASVATTGSASMATTGNAAIGGAPSVTGSGAPGIGGGTAAEAAAAGANHAPIGPGSTIGDFTVVRALGGGGMATVYLASAGDGREVALKVMQPQLANDPLFVQRFLHEVRSTIDIHHGNVVEVFSYGEEGGRYWMASEYVDAGTVDELMVRIQRMPAPLAVEIFAQLVTGLDFAHRQGIVHRDVKPANMLLTASGILKVADFGIAKTVGGAALTQTGMLVGTPAYMSPEQARGEALDARSDLYAAGIVLYELLSGENPNAADDAASTVARLLKGVVPPIYEREPTVPPVIEVLLDELLSGEPADRPASGQAVLQIIEPYLSEHRARRPRLLADALADPEATIPVLIQEDSAHWLAEGQRLLAAGPAERRQASLALYRAVLRDPENTAANQLLTEVCQAEGIQFGQSANQKVLELEALLEEDPTNAGVLQRLANLYRNEGNLYKAVGFFKRYLRLRPDDGYTAGQLSLLTGHSVEIKQRAPRRGPGGVMSGGGVVATGVSGASLATGAGVASTGAPSSTGNRPAIGPDTAALVAGVHTGGFQAAGPVSPGGRPEFSEISEPEPDPSVLDYARAVWSAWGMKIVLAAVVIGLAWGGYRFIGNAISGASAETDRAAADLAKGMNSQETETLKRTHAQGMAEASQAASAEAKRLFEDARGLYRKGRYDEAIAALEGVRESYPKRPQAAEALFYLAKARLDTQKYWEAASAFQTFIDEQAGSEHYVPALMGLAQARFGNGQIPETITVCTRLIDDHPTSALVRQARILRGQAHESRKDFSAAADDYRFVVDSTSSGVPYYDEARAGLSRVAPDSE